MEENGGINTLQNYNVYSKVFLWMFMGLILTGVIGWYGYSTGLVNDLIVNGAFGVIMLVELAVVIILALLLPKMTATIAAIMFFLYAALNGITFSVIFAVYELTSVISIFFIAAFVFGVFALLGYRTNIDLTKMGSILIMALFGGLIVGIINMFVGNSMLDMILSWVMLVVFLGITAYDMQKIKNMAIEGRYGDKLHIYGALELYVDFINIFIRLLSLFGKRN